VCLSPLNAGRRMASLRVATSQPQAAGSTDIACFTSGNGIGSMNMDDIICNIYDDTPPPEAATDRLVELVSAVASDAAAIRWTTEEVWNEISAVGALSVPAAPLLPPATTVMAVNGGGGGASEMTLEDFLARDTGAARALMVEGTMALGFPDGNVMGAGGGRARKRVANDPTDRAVVQRQKRMIKKRESMARSRDRKQVRFDLVHLSIFDLLNSDGFSG
jgi:ABA responsive element binding factor